MDELDEELSEIKKEIVEARGLIIKTNNLASSLSADLRAINKRQQSFERRAFFNSAFAFGIFVFVVVGIVYVAWNARVESVGRESADAKEQLRRATEEIDLLKRRLSDSDTVANEASAYYELVRAGRRRELIDGFDAIRAQPLSKVELQFFTDAVDKAKAELSLERYQEGLGHLRASRFNEAARSLEESVALAPMATHIPSAKLELGRALHRLRRDREAIAILAPLAEASSNPDVLDDATLLLAECLISIQAINDARATLRSFIKRFPQSPLLEDAYQALSDLNQKQ